MNQATTLSTHDIDDVLHVLNAVLSQIDLRFQPVEEATSQTSHDMAYISNQLTTILRRLDAIETAQASTVRRLQDSDTYNALRRPYRDRVRTLAATP